MEHLSLEIFDRTGTGSKYATLPDDTNITITDTSDIFASGDVWSHSFTLNIPANAHIFGSSGEIHGSRLHEQINKRKARLWVEGLPLYLGYLTLADEVDVDEDGNIDVTFESGQKTFDDMIEGAKANQVPMLGDVRYGMALWRKRKVEFETQLAAAFVLEDESSTDFVKVTDNGSSWIKFTADGEDDYAAVQEYPRMVYPKGTFKDTVTGDNVAIDYLNTDNPYDEDEDGTPTHPYCNVALCYQKYGYEKKTVDDNVITDYSSEPEAQRGYEYMPANRVNSAPNFYVLYWLRALMKHLGIYVEENQMLAVEDLRRLFFVNTNCAYKEPDRLRDPSNYDGRYGRYKFSGDRLLAEYYGPTMTILDWDEPVISMNHPLVKVDECGLKSTGDIHQWGTLHLKIDHAVVKVRNGAIWGSGEKDKYEQANSFLHDAYATSECFPDVDISEVIKAMETGFGVRFVFSDDYKRVRILLLRDIFNSRDVQQIEGDIVGETKTENCIRGFRMTYGENTDTHFYYKGFADLLPHKKEMWPDTSDTHDYSKWKLDAKYSDLLDKISAFDRTCYVDPATGDAYGIKVDKDAKRYDELHPSLFEYAGFMDAEDGDCTGEDETIETITVGFAPAIMNDINFEQQRDKESDKQRYALFIDETMRPRRPDLQDGKDYDDPESVYSTFALYADESVAQNMKSDDGIVKPGEFAITSDMYATKKAVTARITWDSTPIEVTMDIEGHINEGYRLYLQDNFEPNDEGISPIEKHDWGLTLGIMRGSGSDAYVKYEADPDDQEGNDTWEVMAGTNVTSHPDTCDNYGRIFDYTADGQEDPQDTTGRFSLKLRAEKPNPDFDPSKEESETNKRYLEVLDEDGKLNTKLSRRGLADQFYKEYSYWIRNARIDNVTVNMTLAQLLGIDKTKRVKVGDTTGFIRKMQYSVSKNTGLGMVAMEILYI